MAADTNKFFCNFCDKPVADDAVICPHCGADLNDENASITEEQFFCTSCNQKVKEEDIVCPKCGVNLVEMMQSDELVVLRDLTDDKTAKKAADLLKANGVESLVSAVATAPAKLVVLKNDLEKAKEILDKSAK